MMWSVSILESVFCGMPPLMIGERLTLLPESVTRNETSPANHGIHLVFMDVP